MSKNAFFEVLVIVKLIMIEGSSNILYNFSTFHSSHSTGYRLIISYRYSFPKKEGKSPAGKSLVGKSLAGKSPVTIFTYAAFLPMGHFYLWGIFTYGAFLPSVRSNTIMFFYVVAVIFKILVKELSFLFFVFLTYPVSKYLI